MGPARQVKQEKKKEKKGKGITGRKRTGGPTKARLILMGGSAREEGQLGLWLHRPAWEARDKKAGLASGLLGRKRPVFFPLLFSPFG